MPDSPSSQRRTKINQSSLLPTFAILIAAGALTACGQAIDTPTEPVAEETATTENALVKSKSDPSAPVRLNSSTTTQNCDGDRNWDDHDDEDEDECLVPGPFTPYFSNEEAHMFKSVKSTVFPYYDPSVCNTAPFVPTFSSGGRMTSMIYRLSDATVGNPEKTEVGYGTLCFKVQDPTFTPFGPPLLAYGKLTVDGQTITINGHCTVTNAALPSAGVWQMVCALPVVAPVPVGYAGGLLTTNSVLNLGAVPGISSGSLLALHMYKQVPVPIQFKATSTESALPQINPLLPGASIW